MNCWVGRLKIAESNYKTTKNAEPKKNHQTKINSEYNYTTTDFAEQKTQKLNVRVVNQMCLRFAIIKLNSPINLHVNERNSVVQAYSKVY